MFEIAIALAVVLGLVAGGRLENLFRIQLRWAWLLFAAVLLRFGTEAAIRYDVAAAGTLRLPLYALAFGLLAGVLWVNRAQPGLLVAAAGITANGIAIVVNGGWMPVWGPALQLVGLGAGDLVSSFHRLLPEQLGMGFLLQAGPFGDLIPIPFPYITNVASIGDAFVAVGLAWFVFASFVSPRAPKGPEPEPASAATASERAGERASRPATVPASAMALAPTLRRSAPLHLAPRAGVRDAAVLRRPILMGGTTTGLALPPRPVPSAAAAAATAVAVRPPWAARLAGHAYVRLALDARFSAMWLGQLISLLGDRLNQVALGVLVFSITGSALEVGLTFLSATLPNLLFGPIAGTLVDRWDQKRVMIVSDLLRAGLVLLIPLAADRDVHLVYPVVFAVTTVSIFFRPARDAIRPRIVDPDDLNAANAATWTAENFADIGGYAFAGVFVAFLGVGALTIAFWCDAASYVMSAFLLASITIPPVARSAAPIVGGALRRFTGELAAGWHFLTGEPSLFQNTLMSAIGQLSVGATIALMVVYAKGLDGRIIPYPQNYAALDMAIGLGNLAGGVAIGAIANRWRKGYLVIAGYLVMGFATVVLGSTGNELLAFSCMLVIGVSNMVFLIPTQTLFAERTPADLMGRVIGTRFSIVFGSLTGAMAVSGIMAESMGAGAVFVVFGGLTALAGVIGILLPAVRDV